MIDKNSFINLVDNDIVMTDEEKEPPEVKHTSGPSDLDNSDSGEDDDDVDNDDTNGEDFDGEFQAYTLNSL